MAVTTLASVCAAIDPDAFGILLRNLIDNALKYGSTDQPVEVSLTSQGLLRVVNAGGAVPKLEVAIQFHLAPTLSG